MTGEAPLVLFKIKRVLYWGETPNQLLDFTTMDDTAAYTAEAALDPGAPPILRIAENRSQPRAWRRSPRS